MTASMANVGPSKDKFWLRIIYVVSAAISAAIAFLILGPRPEGMEGALDVSRLPLVNASLNAITTILLIAAGFVITKKKVQLHKNLMLTAFGTSTAFLVTYVIYHWYKAGPKLYTGDLRAVYLFILVSHIVLAAIIVPLALVTLYRGWNMQLQKHRKIAKLTLPLWIYVSITGVVIYYMLYL